MAIENETEAAASGISEQEEIASAAAVEPTDTGEQAVPETTQEDTAEPAVSGVAASDEAGAEAAPTPAEVEAMTDAVPTPAAEAAAPPAAPVAAEIPAVVEAAAAEDEDHAMSKEDGSPKWLRDPQNEEELRRANAHIAAESARIREGWSEAERERRRVAKSPIVATHEFQFVAKFDRRSLVVESMRGS